MNKLTCCLMDAAKIDSILHLQEQVVAQLADPQVYVAATREELAQVLKDDVVLGMVDADRLAAVAICIRNRDCGGNLGQKCGFPPEDCFTFDAVFVCPRYRGQGLQRKLIEAAKKIAQAENAVSMWCTVSPDNPFSYENFTKMGFLPHETGVLMYGGKVRDILKLDLK